MAVITISRQFGAGGKTLGRMIAESLNYTFADSTIVQRMAKEANVSTDWVIAHEKEAGTTFSRLINSMVSRSLIDRVIKDERGYLDEQIYLDYLVLIIAQIADEGDVVILGRGSQYILKDHPEAFHILLIDTLENRIKFMVDHYELAEKKARQVVNFEDKRRTNLYRKLGKADYDSPTLYHMVLNMERFSLNEALKQVVSLIN